MGVLQIPAINLGRNAAFVSGADDRLPTTPGCAVAHNAKVLVTDQARGRARKPDVDSAVDTPGISCFAALSQHQRPDRIGNACKVAVRRLRRTMRSGCQRRR